MATEYEQILMERQKAKKSVIANSIGFCVAVLVTVLTYLSPSPVFLIAWGGIIFCPISAARSYSKYKKLKAMIPFGMP